ncbi:MAG: sulfatase [Thermoguttaceae bacterium]|nr:sulfatase [Thermoguttaceae bacterium]
MGTSIARAADEPSKARWNVLFLIADDLNNMLGCYGYRLAKTPNIDRLAASGVRFDRAYNQFPLCAPSRNSFLTGLYPGSTGVINNRLMFRQIIPQHVSMPQAFRLAGYFVARVGKLYHYGVPRSIGTDGHDDPVSWEVKINPIGVDRAEEEPNIFSLIPGQFGGTLSWYASPKGDRHHTDGKVADEALWLLERCVRSEKRPFFLAVGFYRPHTPYVAPKEYFDLYPLAEIPLIKPGEGEGADLPWPALATRRKEEMAMSDDLRRQALQAYLASISFMDAQVGRVLQGLESLGLKDRTIIVFTSDHGYHMGEHGLYQKMTLFEESARVPLIVVVPGLTQPGSVVAAPVGLVDLYPTLAELCGIKAPENLQGQSLVNMLRDPTEKGRGWALTQVTRGRNGRQFFGYSIRTERYRYTEWDEGREGRELYDHEVDPRELVNRADDPSYKQVVKEMSQLLREAIRHSMPASGQIPHPPEKPLDYVPVLHAALSP